MVVRKQKKVTKYRGSKTHGGGSMKKRRGAGHRGGRGRAGSGKRGDGKKPRYWSEKADKGFTSIYSRDNTINVGALSSSILTLVEQGFIEEKAGVYHLDLGNIKVDKLLGSGFVHHKLALTVSVATDKAVEKITAAGGSVTVTSKKE